MSFNSTDKSGIAEPLPITDFLQFIPSIGAGVVMGFEQILKLFPNALKTEAQIIAQRTTSQGGVSFVKNQPLGRQWYDIFKPIGTSVVTTVTKKPTIPANLLSKTNVITTGIFGTTLASSLFLQSPQGQNTVNTAGQAVSDVTNLGKSVNDLFTKNPILPIGLIILGGLIVVSVIKK